MTVEQHIVEIQKHHDKILRQLESDIKKETREMEKRHERIENGESPTPVSPPTSNPVSPNSTEEKTLRKSKSRDDSATSSAASSLSPSKQELPAQPQQTTTQAHPQQPHQSSVQSPPSKQETSHSQSSSTASSKQEVPTQQHHQQQQQIQQQQPTPFIAPPQQPTIPSSAPVVDADLRDIRESSDDSKQHKKKKKHRTTEIESRPVNQVKTMKEKKPKASGVNIADSNNLFRANEAEDIGRHRRSSDVGSKEL